MKNARAFATTPPAADIIHRWMYDRTVSANRYEREINNWNGHTV